MADIGRTIRVLRTAKGLLMKEMVPEGCSRVGLTRIEQGKRKPDPGLIEEIAKRLGVPVAALILSEYPKFPMRMDPVSQGLLDKVKAVVDAEDELRRFLA